MKKQILAVVVLLMTAVMGLHAQSRIGILAGITSSDSNVKEFKTSSVSLYHAGVAANFPLGLGFAIQPQVGYQVKGVSMDQITSVSSADAINSLETKVGYLEVPVQIQWGPDLVAFRPYVFGEPFIGYGLTMQAESDKDTVKNDFDKFSMNRVEYGLGLGVGLEVWKIQLAAKYFWNFGSLADGDNKVSTDAIVDTVSSAFKDKKNFNGMAVSLAFFF